MANTLWAGDTDNKIMYQSGEFLTTIKDSQDINGIDARIRGISYNGTNTPWCGDQANKLYLHSGLITETLKTSQAVGGIEGVPSGISWQDPNTLWCGDSGNKLYETSGEFTNTLKDSEDVTTIDLLPKGISWDGTDTFWCGDFDNKTYLQSGKFTGTVKTSQNIGTTGDEPAGWDNTPYGIGWSGADTLIAGDSSNKLYRMSGAFTETLKDSEPVSLVDTSPRGIETDDVDARLGTGGGGGRIMSSLVGAGGLVHWGGIAGRGGGLAG